MDRDFVLLGLREEASEEEIRAAYERRLAKYKTADYADDPDYVRRKTAELKAAYERAVQKSEKMPFRRFSEEAAGEDERETAERLTDVSAEGMQGPAHGILEENEKRQRRRKLEYEQKKRRMTEEESGSIFENLSSSDDGRTDSRSEEKRIRRSRKNCEREKMRMSVRNGDDGDRGFRRPDLSSLKVKAQQLKQYTKEWTDDIKSGLEDYREEEREYHKEEDNSTPMEILNEAGEAKVTSKEFSEEGFKTIEEKNSSIKNVGLGVQIIVAFIITAVGFFFIGGNDADDDYMYDDYTEIIYHDSDYAGDNEKIRESGDAFRSYFNSEATVYSGEWESVSDNDENLHKAADRFAELYSDYDSMSGLCAALYNEVAAFPAGENDYVEYQVREVLNYYGFPSPEEVIGTVNSYTGKDIQNMTQYLRYLNRFYEEQRKGETAQ